jgi:phosphohistidine phosphatase SixA
MRNVFAIGGLVAALVCGGATAQAEGLTGKAMVQELAKGGYAVFMRHTKTDNSQKDSDVSNLDNCATQRNLSDEGREQAKAMGEALKHVGAKFGEVISSPYCRAVETAKIMFGQAAKHENLSYLTRLPKDKADAASAWLKAELAKPVAAGANRILISHTANLKQGTGHWPKEAGDMYVYKADGKGGYVHVGTVLAADWKTMVE